MSLLNFGFNCSLCQENGVLDSGLRVCSGPADSLCIANYGIFTYLGIPYSEKDKRRPFDFSSRASHLALSLRSNQANSASGFIGESIEWHLKICSGAYF